MSDWGINREPIEIDSLSDTDLLRAYDMSNRRQGKVTLATLTTYLESALTDVTLESLTLEKAGGSIITLKNTTPEDSAGGRQTRIDFRGVRSGGEEALLAQIIAQHNGTGDDEKGDIRFLINGGSSGETLVELMRVDGTGSIVFSVIPNASATGIRTRRSTENTANPPTISQLDTAFGGASAVGAGFLAILDDNGAESVTYIIYSTGTKWWHIQGTAALP